MKRETKTACTFGAALAIGAILVPMTLSRNVYAADLGLQDPAGLIRSDPRSFKPVRLFGSDGQSGLPGRPDRPPFHF